MPSLRHAAAKAWRSTDHYKLRQLLDQESRWKRKVTIATNKLADVRSQINQHAEKMANQLAGLADKKDPQT